jgi:hypothetical protein
VGTAGEEGEEGAQEEDVGPGQDNEVSLAWPCCFA